MFTLNGELDKKVCCDNLQYGMTEIASRIVQTESNGYEEYFVYGEHKESFGLVEFLKR